MLNPQDWLRNNWGAPGGLAGLRLGRGVLANTTYGFIATSLATPAIIWAFGGAGWAIPALVLIWGGFAYYFHRSLVFAEKHPESALLGGSEWLRYHQGQIAGKGVPDAPGGEIIEAPDVNQQNLPGVDDT